MRIDLTCPAEIFRTVMPTEDIPAVSLTMYNLSDRVIASAEVTARLLSATGAEKEKVVFRGRALNGRPHSTFTMNVPMNPAAGAKKAEVTLDKVWFIDNDTWRRDESAETEYEPNALPVSNALTNLKYAAGENAVGFPSQQEGLWVCVCGRPNPDRETVCARCRLDKETVFRRFSREAVENLVSLREKQLDISSRGAREDTARLQRIREAEYNERKARRGRRIRLAAAVVLLFAITAGVVGWGIPELRMITAGQAMEAGDYEAARAAYEELAGFPGAADQAAECEWQIARRNAAESEDPEVLKESAAALRAAADRDGSHALADDADLRRARMLDAAGDRDGAREAISALAPDNEARLAMEADWLFAEASADLEAGNYAPAREAFLSLGSYPGAAEMANECLYRPAAEMIAEGRYDDAIYTLSRIPEYRDSRRLTLQCHYMKAAACEAEGDMAGASAEYLMAGDWEDAPEKTRETTYLLAEDIFESGDLIGAQGLYASIPGYADADEKNHICLYAMGRDAFDDMEYNRAWELLSQLPEGYEDADSYRKQAAYEAGKKALEQGDYLKAIRLLSDAGDYRNAEKLLIQAMEMNAANLPAGEPEPEEPAPTPEPYDAAEYAIGDGEEDGE